MVAGLKKPTIYGYPEVICFIKPIGQMLLIDKLSDLVDFGSIIFLESGLGVSLYRGKYGSLES